MEDNLMYHMMQVVMLTFVLDDIIDDVADISYYFFNKPLAPHHGDGSLNENIGAGYIICNWTLPQKTKSALPFGDASQYPDGKHITSLLH